MGFNSGFKGLKDWHHKGCNTLSLTSFFRMFRRNELSSSSYLKGVQRFFLEILKKATQSNVPKDKKTTNNNTQYCTSKSTKSPALGVGNVSEPKLIISRESAPSCVRVDHCVLQSERRRFQCSSSDAAGAIMCLMEENGKVCVTRAQGCYTKWRGLGRRNPAIHRNP